MDNLTQQFYSTQGRHPPEQPDIPEALTAKLLLRGFAEGMRVLVVGAQTGRDVDLLMRMGCLAYGVEPRADLRAIVAENNPSLVSLIQYGSLPSLGQPFGGSFDGVLCLSALMHLRRADIVEAAISLRSVLTDNGRLLLSVAMDEAVQDTSNLNDNGRSSAALPPDYRLLLFERVGFRLLDRWESQRGPDRPGSIWCYLLLQAQPHSGSRPLDQIEGILNRDRKTATYKLALIRALGEIAMTEFEQAKWKN